MAREIIQMYDKYHSTKKVYPKVIEECLPEGYQGLPETVEEIPVVEANPTLEGTETELEGLKIDGTKYKIGGGKTLYQHNLVYSSLDTRFMTQINITIINDNNTPITTQALLNSYLYNNGFISASRSLLMNGVSIDDNNTTRRYDMRAVFSPSANDTYFNCVSYYEDTKKVATSQQGAKTFEDIIIEL